MLRARRTAALAALLLALGVGPTHAAGVVASTETYGGCVYRVNTNATELTPFCAPDSSGFTAACTAYWQWESGPDYIGYGYGWGGACYRAYSWNGNYAWNMTATSYAAVRTCPANSTLNGTTCACNAGYEPNGPATACVVPPTEERSCSTANPVQPGTGRKRFTDTDYAGAGAHPLNLTRHYSSRWTDGAAAAGLAPIAAWDGGWRHAYQASLTARPDGSLRAFRPDGTMLGFTASASAANTWTAVGSRDTVSAMVDTGGQRTGYTYAAADDDSTETYDAAGRLLTLKARNGWTTTLSYSDATTPAAIAPGPGLLISVKNHFGRELKFTYDAQGRTAELLAPGAISGQPAGSAISPIRYVYGEPASLGAGVPAQSQLTSVVWQDGAVKRYHYEDARWPNAVTGITDEAGVRYGSYAYDAQGRVTRSELAGGTERLDFAYGTDAAGQATTTVTDYASGSAASRSYVFTDIGNVRYPQSLSAPCSLCGSTQQQSTYDASGNPVKTIAHDGTVTFYAYDAKGRESERATFASSYASATTRPALSAATKVVSTQWHATFNLPTQTAEPNKLTANTYDAKGMLTGQSWTATTDATGAATFSAAKSGSTFATGWGYDGNGLATTILTSETAAGKRKAVETGRWTLGYNAAGDVSRVTDASVTPNAIASISTFSAGGQPSTGRLPDGRTFTYGYGADSQVSSLQLSDGYRVDYSYNARRQLTEARATDGGLLQITIGSDGTPIKYTANGEIVFDRTGSAARSASVSSFFTAAGVASETLPRPIPLPEINWGSIGSGAGAALGRCIGPMATGLSLLLFSSEVGTCSTVDGRANKKECKKDPCENELPTSTAARREAMRRVGLPVESSVPVASNLSVPGFEQYVYWVPSQGAFVVLSHHPADGDHPCPHWHAGAAKMTRSGSSQVADIDTFSNGAWRYSSRNVVVAHRNE